MKAIIYKDDYQEFWLHINKIQTIQQHKYAYYTQVTIKTTYMKQIKISDSAKGYSSLDIHNFITSEKDIQIIKVHALHIGQNEVSMSIKDWVQQAMG